MIGCPRALPILCAFRAFAPAAAGRALELLLLTYTCTWWCTPRLAGSGSHMRRWPAPRTAAGPHMDVPCAEASIRLPLRLRAGAGGGPGRACVHVGGGGRRAEWRSLSRIKLCLVADAGPGGGALARRSSPQPPGHPGLHPQAPAARLRDATQKSSPDAAGSRHVTQLQGAAPHPPSAHLTADLRLV